MYVERARGFSAVEVAAAIAITGAVLAVAVPAFVHELHASKLTEPVSGLEHIGINAVAYAAAHDAFPPSAPLTPSIVPRGVRVEDPQGTWDAPTWKALDFRPLASDAPHEYSFAFTSAHSPSTSSFVTEAHGDLDGDGVTSTFELRGHRGSGDPGGGEVEPGMYVDAELE